jgi:hypothetical protein
MAQRRMFSLKIVGSDAFLDMPVSVRELYFQLGMYADDDGFINPKKIIRMVGSADDDLKMLIAKRFVLPFENGVVVIKHWAINNLIRKDFYQETIYTEQKKQLEIKENKAYTELNKKNVDKMLTNCHHSIGKDRLDKVRLGKERLVKNTSDLPVAGVKEIMDIFFKINPTLNWGNKTTRRACEDLIKRFGLEATLKMATQIVSVQGQPYAPVATTPYQMMEKLAQFKIYFDSQKEKSKKFSVDIIS